MPLGALGMLEVLKRKNAFLGQKNTLCVIPIGLSEHLLLWGLVLNFAHLGMLGLPW